MPLPVETEFLLAPVLENSLDAKELFRQLFRRNLLLG